jgi:YHS domain-containing protein
VIKLFLYFLILWAVFKLWKMLNRLQGPGKFRPDSADAGRIDGGELIQDPHCGVYIPKATAVKDRAGACFCSEACREAFRRKGV